MVASRRRALSDCRFVTRRCSIEFRRAASASRVRVLRPSAARDRVDSTEGVRVGTVCRCERSRSIREFCESVRLGEVDDRDSVGLSDPNRERVPNVDCVWGTVVFVESLPIRVAMLRERDTSENDRMRELNVELVEDLFNDRVWGTVVFVELLPIRVAMLCELARPDDDVLGVDGREYVVGGLVTVVEPGVRGRADSEGLEIDGRLPTTIRLRLGLLLDPEDDELDRDRLGLGATLRVEGIARLRLNVTDRDGIVMRGLTDRLGADRCTLGREIDRLGIDRCTLGREIDRLGIDRCTLGREIDRLGIDRCTLGREIDRLGMDLCTLGGEIDRLGADRAA